MEAWETYEEVATYLLDQFASEFGLQRVEGKQEVTGKRSHSTWEIDAKGFRRDDSGFVIVECRRYTTSRQSQERIGGLAYRIIDTGAEGGILVSPLGLQKGAKLVANAENIVSVLLDEQSNRYEYVLQFLDRIMVGLRDSVTITDALHVEVRDKDGKLVRRERYE